MFLWKAVSEYFVVMENRMEIACFQVYCIVNELSWELDINRNRMLLWKVVCIDFC